jgi:hypothetical protein
MKLRVAPGMRRRLLRITALSAVAMVALAIGLARAQQPNFSSGGILEKAPNGWHQSDWNGYRGRCLQLGALVGARRNMTSAPVRPTITCGSLVVRSMASLRCRAYRPTPLRGGSRRSGRSENVVGDERGRVGPSAGFVARSVWSSAPAARQFRPISRSIGG